MSFYLKNNSKGPADIDLYIGGRARIAPSSTYRLKEDTLTEEGRNYYKQLKVLNIDFFEEVVVKPVMQETVEEVVAEVEEEKLPEPEVKEETVTTEPIAEAVNNDFTDKELEAIKNPSSAPSVLAGLRVSVVAEIAKNKGVSFAPDATKKEIIDLILGN